MKLLFMLLWMSTVSVTVALLFWHHSGRYERQGRADALRDLKNGILRIEYFGLDPGPARTRTELLYSRYGIVIDMVAGCSISEEQIGHMRGYNQVMETEIYHRSGDVLRRFL